MTLGEKTRIIFSKLGCHGFSIFKEIFFDEFYRFKIVFIKYIPWRFAISGKRRLTVNILKKLRQICRVSFPCFCHANQGNEHSKQGRGKTSKRCLNKSLIQRVYEISLNTGCNLELFQRKGFCNRYFQAFASFKGAGLSLSINIVHAFNLFTLA